MTEDTAGAAMKALTVWQPWASLIIIGAKPYEFRRWSFTKGPRAQPALVGQRIVIHASARPARVHEIREILDRINEGMSALEPELALPALNRIRGNLIAAHRDRETWKKEMRAFRGQLKRATRRKSDFGDPIPEHLATPPPEPDRGQPILAAGLGTVVLGEPVKAIDLFAGVYDSSRIDQHVWAWPMLEIEPFDEPVMRPGAQGFWNWR